MKPSRTNRLVIPPERLDELKSRIMRNSEKKPSGCWEWKLSKSPLGYGNTTCGSDLRGPAHKFSYAAFVGVVPAGMVVRHKCDVPYCVNPEHLELGSQWQNAMDCIRRGRTNFPKKREYCVRGLHKMEGHNLIVWKSKKLATGEPYWGRQCRACKRQADAKKRKLKSNGVTDTDALRAQESKDK